MSDIFQIDDENEVYEYRDKEKFVREVTFGMMRLDPFKKEKCDLFFEARNNYKELAEMYCNKDKNQCGKRILL